MIARLVAKKTLPLCWVLMILFLPACDKGGEQKASGDSSRPAAQPAGVPQATGKLSVRILPEQPTALTNLLAVLAGGGPGATFQWQRNGMVIPGEEQALLSNGLFAKGDRVSVIARSGEAEATATAVIANTLPRIDSVHFDPSAEAIWRGVDITVSPLGSDADGDQVRFRYQWMKNGELLPDDGPVLKGTSFKRGDKIQFRVTAFDGDGEGDSYLSGIITIQNAPPRIVSSPPPETEGDMYTYRVVAEDSDGDPITFFLTSGPPGMSIDAPTGVIQWKVDERQAGDHMVEIVAQDTERSKFVQKFTLTVPAKKEVAP